MGRSIINRPSSFETVNEGPQVASVFAYYALGEHLAYGEEKRRVSIDALGLEFVNDRTGEGSPKRLWLMLAESLHPKSKLGSLVQAAGLMPAPGQSLDLDRLVGANVTAIIAHETKGDRVYANVTSFAKLAHGVVPVRPINPPTTPMPEWLRKKRDARLDQDQADAPADTSKHSQEALNHPPIPIAAVDERDKPLDWVMPQF